MSKRKSGLDIAIEKQEARIASEQAVLEKLMEAKVEDDQRRNDRRDKKKTPPASEP
jgi:hypothetical protein